MGTSQKLGIKVFYYYLSKKISVGLLLLIASIVFSSLKSAIISKIIFLFPKSLSTAIVSYFSIGLFIVSILLIFGGLLMSWFNYINLSFTLDENSFNIRRGIFSKKEVSIPYRQIQDVDIEQTFFNRMMGVGKLVILTAGNDDHDKEGESEGVFRVIDYKVAEQMRKDILQRTNVQTVREVKNNNLDEVK